MSIDAKKLRELNEPELPSPPKAVGPDEVGEQGLPKGANP